MWIKDIEEGEYGLEGLTRWELFGEEIEVNIDKGVDPAYAEKCAEALNALSEETIRAIWEAAKKYCLYFTELCGDDWNSWNKMSFEVTEETPAEKLKSEIFPRGLIVNRPKDERIGFHLECNCSWEPEHGLEITILDGKLVYLGAYDGNGAWDNFDPDDEWNFVNNVHDDDEEE